MSRIGRKPIDIPQTVNVNIKEDVVKVKGPFTLTMLSVISTFTACGIFIGFLPILDISVSLPNIA
jgi:hypothetical protein